MEPHDDRLVQAVAQTLGAVPAGWRRTSGGYTQAERWVVSAGSDESAFVKAGLTLETAGWLRDEYRVYGGTDAPFLAKVRGWHDIAPDAAVLILEDLSAGDWPPPWQPGQVDEVRRTLELVHATIPPQGLPRLEDYRDLLTRWHAVAADPSAFLSLGVCTASWLDASLPALVECEAGVLLDGNALLHLDVRSDNLCFDGSRTVLVDWNWACTGNADVDLAAWLVTLPAEGVALRPWEILHGRSEIAALLSGYFAYWSGMPPPATTDSSVRLLQRRTLVSLLEWTARELGLGAPDGPPSAEHA